MFHVARVRAGRDRPQRGHALQFDGDQMALAQWLDISIVAASFVAAVFGWRAGAVGSALSLVGVVLGTVAAVMLAAYLVASLPDTRIRFVVVLVLIIAFVAIGEIAGLTLGRALRGTVRHGALRTMDSVGGVLVQLVVVAVALALVYVPLKGSTRPELIAAVHESKIMVLGASWAPQPLRRLSRALADVMDSSGLADVLHAGSAAQIVPVDAPDAMLASLPVVNQASVSVVKISGVASVCNESLTGTGFVISPHRVMTNAHVVAGTDMVRVQSQDRTYQASVIVYNPDLDIAILAVEDLPAPALAFASRVAHTGEDAIILGYPGGGDYTATPGRVREVVMHRGPNIYLSTTVIRKVYRVRAPVLRGESGGPLIDRAGQVLGVVFGSVVGDDDTGLAVTIDQAADLLADAVYPEHVATGACTPRPSV